MNPFCQIHINDEITTISLGNAKMLDTSDGAHPISDQLIHPAYQENTGRLGPIARAKLERNGLFAYILTQMEEPFIEETYEKASKLPAPQNPLATSVGITRLFSDAFRHVFDKLDKEEPIGSPYRQTQNRLKQMYADPLLRGGDRAAEKILTNFPEFALSVADALVTCTFGQLVDLSANQLIRRTRLNFREFVSGVLEKGALVDLEEIVGKLEELVNSESEKLEIQRLLEIGKMGIQETNQIIIEAQKAVTIEEAETLIEKYSTAPVMIALLEAQRNTSFLEDLLAGVGTASFLTQHHLETVVFARIRSTLASDNKNQIAQLAKQIALNTYSDQEEILIDLEHYAKYLDGRISAGELNDFTSHFSALKTIATNITIGIFPTERDIAIAINNLRQLSNLARLHIQELTLASNTGLTRFGALNVNSSMLDPSLFVDQNGILVPTETLLDRYYKAQQGFTGRVLPRTGCPAIIAGLTKTIPKMYLEITGIQTRRAVSSISPQTQ